jgi:HSP20 family molecular chaperone IbpA
LIKIVIYNILIKEDSMAEEKTKPRFWINPCDCGCDDPDSDMYTLSYELPGVDKNDIDLKVTKYGLQLIAERENIEYYNEFPFACDAVVDEVNALYENGLLTVQVPLNCPSPYKEAKKVEIT